MRDTHSILAGLNDADMVWLLSVGKLRAVHSGERLVEAQRAIADLFFVLRGTLEVVLPDGIRVALLGAGQVIGEMSFVNRRAPSVSVCAVDPAEVLMIPRQAILDRFDREPVFAARFYRAIAMVLSERLRETTAAVGAGRDGDAGEDEARHGGERFRSLLARITGRRDPPPRA